MCFGTLRVFNLPWLTLQSLIMFGVPVVLKWTCNRKLHTNYNFALGHNWSWPAPHVCLFRTWRLMVPVHVLNWIKIVIIDVVNSISQSNKPTLPTSASESSQCPPTPISKVSKGIQTSIVCVSSSVFQTCQLEMHFSQFKQDDTSGHGPKMTRSGSITTARCRNFNINGQKTCSGTVSQLTYKS